MPERPGYNKRLRRSGERMAHVLRALARDCPSRHDDVWLVDSTPVERGRSRETEKRSDLADGSRKQAVVPEQHDVLVVGDEPGRMASRRVGDR